MADTPRNLVKQTISNTPGTSGSLTLSSASTGYLSLGAEDDGLTFSVTIYDSDSDTALKEVRTGCTYTHSSTSLSRGTLESGTAINLTSSAIVMVVLPASVIASLAKLGSNTFTGDQTINANLIFDGTRKIIGGTGTTSDLTLQVTSGVGATGADFHLLVGNNGATEALTVLNSASIGMGTTAPSTKLHVLENTTGTGAATGVTIEQSGAGDALLQFLLTGTQRWVFGIDNSDADRFKVGRGADWITSVDFSISTSGLCGIGTASPTAVLHVKAGTASANTAPFKLTSGTLLTIPEAGAMEYNGTDLFFTRSGTTRETVLTGTTGVTTAVPGNIAVVGYAKLGSYTVSTLPSASSVGAGSRAFVTDSNQTTTAGIGTTVVAGGANFNPVYSDGTNWKIG